MGTYDAYWDMAMDEAERRREQKKTHYWVVINKEGKEINGRHSSESEAIIATIGSGPFHWCDYVAKGYSVKEIDVDKIIKMIKQIDDLKRFYK